MSKTIALRELIKAQLDRTDGKTYHKKAPDDAVSPYKTFSLKSVVFTDARDDLELCVDVWGVGCGPKVVEELADQIEKLFDNVNLPRDTILPTFFREGRTPVEDPDKTIEHIQLRFLVQLYEMEE